MPASPDIFGFGDDHGLVTAAGVIARKAWEGRLDPVLYDWARHAAGGNLMPMARADALWRQIVGPLRVIGPYLDSPPVPDADDFAVVFGAACLACGMPVRLVLAHQRGRPREQVTMLVSVRVAFSLDPDQDRFESWRVYAPEGCFAWPDRERFDDYAYVPTEPAVP